MCVGVCVFFVCLIRWSSCASSSSLPLADGPDLRCLLLCRAVPCWRRVVVVVAVAVGKSSLQKFSLFVVGGG